MSILDQILGRTNKAPVPVATPEWPDLDGRLAVRRLSPQERVEFYSAAGKQEANSGAAFVAFVAAYCTVTEEGQRAFADPDWKALVGDPGSGAPVERLADAADELNVLSSTARENLKKKSEATPVSGCTSTSPATTE